MDRDDLALIVAFAGCSLDEKPGSNWVQDNGGLPEYICRVARAIKRSGHDTSSAIAIAISRIKVWAATGSPSTKAKAAKALAEWEALKGKAKGKRLVKASRQDGSEYLMLCATSFNVDKVRQAFDLNERERRKAYRDAGAAKSPLAMEAAYLDYPYRSIRELWTDFLIVEQGSEGPSRGLELVKIPYNVDPATDEVTFGREIPVKVEYEPLDPSDAATEDELEALLDADDEAMLTMPAPDLFLLTGDTLSLTWSDAARKSAAVKRHEKHLLHPSLDSVLENRTHHVGVLRHGYHLKRVDKDTSSGHHYDVHDAKTGAKVGQVHLNPFGVGAHPVNGRGVKYHGSLGDALHDLHSQRSAESSKPMPFKELAKSEDDLKHGKEQKAYASLRKAGKSHAEAVAAIKRKRLTPVSLSVGEAVSEEKSPVERLAELLTGSNPEVLELARNPHRVKTPEGARLFKQPIGSVIHRDLKPTVIGIGGLKTPPPPPRMSDLRGGVYTTSERQGETPTPEEKALQRKLYPEASKVSPGKIKVGEPTDEGSWFERKVSLGEQSIGEVTYGKRGGYNSITRYGAATHKTLDDAVTHVRLEHEASKRLLPRNPHPSVPPGWHTAPPRRDPRSRIHYQDPRGGNRGFLTNTEINDLADEARGKKREASRVSPGAGRIVNRAGHTKDIKDATLPDLKEHYEAMTSNRMHARGSGVAGAPEVRAEIKRREKAAKQSVSPEQRKALLEQLTSAEDHLSDSADNPEAQAALEDDLNALRRGFVERGLTPEEAGVTEILSPLPVGVEDEGSTREASKVSPDRRTSDTTFAGVQARKAEPTRNHRTAVWEGILGTVYARNDAGEVKYFDYDWKGAAEFAGVSPDRDPRVGKAAFDGLTGARYQGKGKRPALFILKSSPAPREASRVDPQDEQARAAAAASAKIPRSVYKGKPSGKVVKPNLFPNGRPISLSNDQEPEFDAETYLNSSELADAIERARGR